MPNISVIERSTSAPILVSDASIADLQRHFKRCSSSKNETLPINSSVCSCPPEDSHRTCPPKESWTFSPKKPPRYCKDFPRTCLPRKSSRSCLETKKTPVKCECVNSSELNCNDKTKETADRCGHVEELYFNSGAKKRGCSSPRGRMNEKCLDFEKGKSVCSTDTYTKITKDENDPTHQSCSRIAVDSGATCSLVDSTSATCGASASYYHNKLLATLQILQNKGETIAVQADSLAVAEERIAALSERAADLKRELDRKTNEYTNLSKSLDCCKVVQKSDACLATDKPMEDQRDIVNTLENNLCVIEDLYRECFYETAKQENLIEMLRSSYLDVRMMDRQKADQIGRLQTVINTQKWSLDRCQDIALEVDGLKNEISNFLNNSTSTNNDSGMWERSEESLACAQGVQGDLQDDLQDIMEQLRRLQDVLDVACTCDLHEENMKLKRKSQSLEIQVGELQGKLCELECTLASKQDDDLKFKAEIEKKEEQLSCLREQLTRSQDCSKDQRSTCEAMSVQLGQMKASLSEKITEVSQLRQENESQTKMIKDLQEELKKADHIIKENCKMRSEVSCLTTQVSLWRAQLDDSKRRVRALECELARTREHAAHVATCYREKARNVAELQEHLEHAHERGAALCGHARRTICSVRLWMQRMRDKHSEQENLIKEKDSLLKVLQRSLEERQSESQRTSVSENTASCSKCLSSRDERSFCSNTETRRDKCRGPSTSEIPSCSSTPAPIRLARKKQTYNKRCKTWTCEAAVQQPARRDAGSEPGAAPRRRRASLTPRDLSPVEQLLLRVEQLSEALADGNRRWRRLRDER